MERQGKREIPKKTRNPASSSGTVPTCKNTGATQPGVEPGSPSHALLILTTNMTEDTLGKIIRFSTVVEVWLELHRLFDRGTEDKVYDVCVEFFSFVNYINYDIGTHMNYKQWVEGGKPPLPRGKRDVSQLKESVGAVEGLMNATASLAADNDDHGWYIDNGATNHVTNQRDVLTTFETLSVTHSVKTANGKAIQAVGKGSVIVEAQVGGRWIQPQLCDVWYVPQLGRNLFSVLAAQDKHPGRSIPNSFSNSQFSRRCLHSLKANWVFRSQYLELKMPYFLSKGYKINGRSSMSSEPRATFGQGTRLFKNIQDCSKRYRTVQEDTGLFKKIQDFSKEKKKKWWCESRVGFPGRHKEGAAKHP
ncbi:hypothetical protein PR048_010753 [Dryococelus australis]|uniref:Retrovirus-related Pol polyprotein from transposon TNT 1-94-like beta-barrel domain-containing protein n=1 Tax=Dryococelus australis TaxID=614101 RepID=A0ABQ9I3K4_9NEOP|nr:hypothetical protein PR048_010753 [Dryococelus australis]